MTRSIIFAFLVLASFHVNAIVTVSNLRFDGSNPGFTGSVEADLSGASGNTDKSSWHVGSDLVWRQSEYINLLLIGYDYGKSNNETNLNKTFIHARHIHQYNDSFDWELFAQIEQNEFTRLSSRRLLGGGVRFPFDDNILVGIGAFYFEERLDKITGSTDKLDDDGVRITTYWGGDYKYGEVTTFNARVYYQPKIDEFDDYRVLFRGSMKVKISDNLGVKINIGVVHDNQPPQTVEQTDITYRTGIEYNF